MPRDFLQLGTRSVLSIPVLTIIAVVVLVVVGYSCTRTAVRARALRHRLRPGRRGSSTDSRSAAACSSPSCLSGALAGLAGVRLRRPLRHRQLRSRAPGIELQAVGAAVIGGVAIFGGSGTVWGAAIGAVLLVTINRALPILGIPDFWQRAVVGALIISAVVLDRVLSARQERKLVEARDKP